MEPSPKPKKFYKRRDWKKITLPVNLSPSPTTKGFYIVADEQEGEENPTSDAASADAKPNAKPDAKLSINEIADARGKAPSAPKKSATASAKPAPAKPSPAKPAPAKPAPAKPAPAPAKPPAPQATSNAPKAPAPLKASAPQAPGPQAPSNASAPSKPPGQQASAPQASAPQASAPQASAEIKDSLIQVATTLSQSNDNLLNLKAELIANEKAELNRPPEKPLTPEEEAARNIFNQEIEGLENSLNAAIAKIDEKLKRLRPESIKKQKEVEEEINKASQGVDSNIVKAATQPITAANNAAVTAAINSLPANVAELVRQDKALTAVANAKPNAKIDPEAKVIAQLALASNTVPLPTDLEIEWERFYKLKGNDNLFENTAFGYGFFSVVSIKDIKYAVNLKGNNSTIGQLDKLIDYFDNIDKQPYFINNQNAAPLKKEIKENYIRIKEQVKKEYKKKNIVDQETLQGFLRKTLQPNPDYISYRIDLAQEMSQYLFEQVLTINSKKGFRKNDLIKENKAIIKNNTNIDFFTKLKENKSKDVALSYVDVFKGTNKYYGLNPSPELIAFMQKRVEDYTIRARIKAEKDKDIDILLNDYLMQFLNNIVPQFKIGDTVTYTSGWERNKGSGITSDGDDIFSSGVIEDIIPTNGTDVFGKDSYRFVIKGENYLGSQLGKTTPAPNEGGRKLTKKNNKKKKKTRRKLRRKYKKKTQRKKKYTRRRK